ncbi:MAG: tetratricopeptide repeat protein, partial [Actinomycetota bacterium]|nr:tetratricopeptide repeat protein [Actinomycetota bacterium]
QAFARLIETIRQTSGDDREKVRKNLLELFDTLPANDPRSLSARRDLSMALF